MTVRKEDEQDVGTEREQISSCADSKKNAALIHANKPDPASGGCKKSKHLHNSFSKYRHGTVVLEILRMCGRKKRTQ